MILRLKRELVWSRSILIHQRGSALAHLLERYSQTTKLVRAQFREHPPHLPGMLSEGWNDEVLAARGKGDDPNSLIFCAFDAADQAPREETVHRDTN